MDSMNAQQVMSGTEGEVWIDGNYMAQVTSFKAEVNLIKEEVNQVKKRGKQYKTTGWEGKGTIKMNHVSSYMIQKLSDNIKMVIKQCAPLWLNYQIRMQLVMKEL